LNIDAHDIWRFKGVKPSHHFYKWTWETEWKGSLQSSWIRSHLTISLDKEGHHQARDKTPSV
jgi:hypothetical protein